jgi:hypothetical protein
MLHRTAHKAVLSEGGEQARTHVSEQPSIHTKLQYFGDNCHDDAAKVGRAGIVIIPAPGLRSVFTKIRLSTPLIKIGVGSLPSIVKGRNLSTTTSVSFRVLVSFVWGGTTVPFVAA